jgi:hypothetical protein
VHATRPCELVGYLDGESHDGLAAAHWSITRYKARKPGRTPVEQIPMSTSIFYLVLPSVSTMELEWDHACSPRPKRRLSLQRLSCVASRSNDAEHKKETFCSSDQSGVEDHCQVNSNCVWEFRLLQRCGTANSTVQPATDSLPPRMHCQQMG